jgi:hypothetical protein
LSFVLFFFWGTGFAFEVTPLLSGRCFTIFAARFFCFGFLLFALLLVFFCFGFQGVRFLWAVFCALPPPFGWVIPPGVFFNAITTLFHAVGFFGLTSFGV